MLRSTAAVLVGAALTLTQACHAPECEQDGDCAFGYACTVEGSCAARTSGSVTSPFMGPADWSAAASTMEVYGAGAMRGGAGDVRDLDNRSDQVGVTKSAGYLGFTGNVVHQNQSGSSVFFNVVINHPEELVVGQPYSQNVAYGYELLDLNELAVSVYICPNGEGLSGLADDITVNRGDDDVITLTAGSSVDEQQLNMDVFLTEASTLPSIP